jgi:hypothetical protein
MYNKREVQMMAAAAQKAADGTEPLPLDNQVRTLIKRGWLRADLAVDPIRFSRRSLVSAVERGRAEQQVVSSQSVSLAKWKGLSEAAKVAAKSLDKITKLSNFKVGDLQVLYFKQNAPTIFSESNAAVLRSEACDAAAQLHSSIIAARRAAHTIALQANEMALGVAKLKHAPGESFRRGVTIEMMKTWWLLTGRAPSSKRSEAGNPFVGFANAGLQSINPDPDVASCSGVTRSALPTFREWQNSGLLDSVLDEITGDTYPRRNRGE